MKIKKIHFNWHQVNWDNSAGEDFHVYEIGTKGVTEIEEHPAMRDGDKWFYYVRFENGSEIKVFNPNQVFSEP
jgi:hypothetical protein